MKIFFSTECGNTGTARSEIRNKYRNFMRNGEARFMTRKQANETGHGFLFDTLISREGDWSAYDPIPIIRRNVNHLAIPFSYDVHGDKFIEGKNLETEIEALIADWFPDRKCLFSCDPSYFFAINSKVFNYDFLDFATESGGFNSHFILFDKAMDKWVIFFNRLPLTIVSWIDGFLPQTVVCDFETRWKKFFLQEIDGAVSTCSDSMIAYIDKTYSPRLPGYDFPSAGTD